MGATDVWIAGGYQSDYARNSVTAGPARGSAQEE